LGHVRPEDLPANRKEPQLDVMEGISPTSPIEPTAPQETEVPEETDPFERPVPDNSKPLSAITQEYDLEELQAFFERNKELWLFGPWEDKWPLYYDEVIQSYPPEICRSNPDNSDIVQYSVYKVRQGGYYYVFWHWLVNDLEQRERGNPEVYMTTYINEERDPLLFDSLIPGVSTAKDVETIDPFFFYDETCEFTSSYLDDKTLLVIWYQTDVKTVKNYDELIVKEIDVIPVTYGTGPFITEEGYAYYSRILAIRESDLPGGSAS